MKVAIIGSRGFKDYELLEKTLDPVKSRITLIVSGGAIGADRLGEKYAHKNGIPTEIFIPDWDKHGKSAGYIRNEYIIKASDIIVAFWDGYSPGTQHSFKLSKKYDKPIKIIKYNEL
jgi:hypothetical protein